MVDRHGSRWTRNARCFLIGHICMLMYALLTGHSRFVNNITKSVQKEMPPQFRGGLLADTMGLGKSLSILSLIANDRLPSQRDTNSSDYKMPSMATLLVVPPTSESPVSRRAK